MPLCESVELLQYRHTLPIGSADISHAGGNVLSNQNR